MTMRILVTGGAGYIGSHMVRALVGAGHEVTVVDNLSAGRREAVPAGVPLEVADVGDRVATAALFGRGGFDAVIHFAARIQVGESVTDPRLYYTGNVAAAVSLLESALDARVRYFILSSTAAVYGVPTVTPIPETHATSPINPYGETKLVIEHMLASYARAYGLRFAALRYFNAAGADADAGLGEAHEPETHLIPLVIDAALGRRPAVTVFGRDYPTPDGTCVRDYIHVRDLARAHLAALEYLAGGGQSGAFNLGTGEGRSVAEVLREVARVAGRDVPVVEGSRRDGDPPSLVADPSRARAAFGWKAERSALATIVDDAWAWHTRASRGSLPERGRVGQACARKAVRRTPHSAGFGRKRTSVRLEWHPSCL